MLTSVLFRAAQLPMAKLLLNRLAALLVSFADMLAGQAAELEVLTISANHCSPMEKHATTVLNVRVVNAPNLFPEPMFVMNASLTTVIPQQLEEKN